MKKTKTSLFHSSLALLLCFSMFVGSTFAWFSDSISNDKNIITAGNLDLEMYWTDDLNSGEWHNVEENGHNTIFSYDNWEPGYTDVKYIKLVNAGDLALNYKLSLTPQNGVGKLAEVINVYFAECGVAVEQRSDLQNLKAIGLLNNVLNGGATADGTLLAADQFSPLHPSGEVIMTVAMNMLTTAGNEYQNQDAGEFTITALATQASFEKDSFGSDYDVNATLPTIMTGGSASAAVTPVDGKVPVGGVTLNGGAISAFVPEGVALEDNTTKLTLTVTPLKNTTSDITIVNDEILIPVDVHIDGVAEDNIVPIIIDLGEVLPKYLNMGNYQLYHVENGTNSVMTLVADKSALSAHNQFTYDTLTGAVSVAMASFSEVTMVADTAAKWEGGEDHSWYDDVQKTELYIANADQLYSFAKIVGGMVDGIAQDSFKNKTVKLLSDINLNYGTVLNKDGTGNGETKKIFYPVGYWNSDDIANYDDKTNKDIDSGFYTFEGTFDGAGHTISNIYQNTWEMKGDHDWYAPEDQHYRDGMGLFGKVYGGTVKNLTVDNFESDGEITTTGVIASYADFGATFENIAITNCNPRVYNIGNGGIVGCVGWYTKVVTDKVVTFKNITVDNTNTISALWGSYDVACGGIVGQYYPTSGQSSYNYPANPGIHFENCHVAAVMDVYNDVCANYQYYAYRYAGMIIGSIRENLPADENGHIYPNMNGITAKNCTVHYDTWNDYYYCELVVNSKASYTHDHQFSRLEEVKEINGNTITYLDGETDTVPESGRYNYVVVDYTKGHGTENATCYHFVDGKVWNHANAGTETVNGVEIAVEDHAHIYLPFKQLFTGYGWGVTSRWLEAFDGIGVTERDSTDLIEKFEKNDALSGEFLYRVGNGNAFPIGKLFQEVSGLSNKDGVVDSGVHVSVDSLVNGVKFNGTFKNNEDDWTQSTLHITGGTGPALLTIQDYNNCKSYELIVEVVNAKNHSSSSISSLSGNTVLFCDTKLNDGGSLSLSGATLYGNGFEIDMTDGAYTAGGSISSNYVFNLANAHLDNVKLTGAVYTQYGAQTKDNYNRAAVLSSGNSTIVNSYISNCASAVRVRDGNLEIVNSTIKGGNFANVDIRGGHVTLDNVTTINQVKGNDTADGTVVVGLGVVVYYENVLESTTIDIKNGITQYNHLSKAEADKYIEDTNAQSLLDVVFGNSNLSSIRYKDSNNTLWVNTGILSMTSNVGDANITNVSGYSSASTTFMSETGFVHTKVPTASSIANTAPDYETAGQGPIAPAYSFDYTSKNYVAKSDGSNDYCFEDGGTVYISMDEGDTFNWDTSILNTSKNGQLLDYTVSMNGTDYTGKSIAFNSAGNYEVVYAYTDSNNFALDEQGNLIKYDKSYNKTVHISVAVIKETTKHADFKMGSNKVSTEKITIDNTTYISAVGVNADNNNWAYMTINGQKIYYPIVAADLTSEKGSSSYAYFPVFKNVITITDYEAGGTGSAFTYDSSKTELPTGLSAVKGYYAAASKVSSWNDLTNSNLSQTGASKIFKWASSSDASSAPVTYKNVLCYKSPEITADRDAYITLVQYSYTDAANTTYYYYVGYTLKAFDYTSCVTPDTLVTLANGSQVRVDALKGNEELLVWNHETGKLDKAPVAYIVDHNGEVAKREIIHLNFANGKTVKIIGEHVFFDATLNKYVAIDSTNADTFIDHTFVALNAEGTTVEKAALVSVERTIEETVAYEVVSYKHLTCFTEGILSTSAYLDSLLNVFDVDADDLAYTTESVQKDIETYGLYTYADFEGLISEDAFELYNAKYLKIAVGKGYITWDDILALIDTYFNVDVQPIK